MKLLPIKINNDIEYMVDFEHNKSVPNTFIISSKTEGNTICDFYLLGNGIIFHGPEEKSLYIKKTRFSEVKDTQDIFNNLNVDYILTIELVEENPNINHGITTLGQIDNASVEYVHNNHNNIPEEKINISGNIEDVKGIAVEFSVDGRFSQHIVIYISPEGQIRDAVIDSGSESSQIAIFKRDGDYSINNVFSIINSAYRFFTQGRNQDNDEKMREEIINSYQSESDDQSYDPKLFKSVFFAKKNVKAVPKRVYITEDDANEAEPILKLFSLKDEKSVKLLQEYVQLCNMKIASFSGIESPKIVYDGEEVSIIKFANSYCYRRYMNLFSYLILKNLCSATNQDDADECDKAKLLSLHILMPNVYGASKIQKYVDFIREDIINLISNTNNFKTKIRGVSVMAVSESDASLMGTIQMRNGEFKDGKYLIIDAGKGTTDFSIVEYKDGNYFSNMKSGIIGASAAISYGLLLDLIQTYNDKNRLGYNNIKDYIYQVILGHSIDGTNRIANSGDLYYIQQMLDAIDRYKIRYSYPGLMYDPSTEASDNSNPQDALPINKFTKWISDYNYKVKGRYVSAIIEKMVDNILERTKEKLADVEYVILAGRGLKFKQFRDTLKDSIKAVNSNIKFMNFDRNSSLTEKNVCLFIPDIIHKGKYKSYYEIYNMPSDNNDNNKSKIKIKRKSQNKEQYYHFEAGGIFEGTKKGRYKINGSVYQLTEDVTEGSNIFCDDKGQFVIRYDNNKTTILKETNTIDDTSMAFPSLFPNWNINSQDVIYIPEITTNHNDNDNNNNNDIETASYNGHDNSMNQTNNTYYDRIRNYYENQ